MKKSCLMRMASVLLMTLSAVMSMQAETAENILNAMDGDTITFAYSVNGNYYLMAAESSNNIVADAAVSKENNLRALWVVKKDGTNANGFRLKNVGNNKWLKVTYTPGKNKNQPETYTYGLVDQKTNSTLFTIDAVSDESNYAGRGRGVANISFPRVERSNGYPYYDNSGSNSRWWGSDSKSVMRIEQWSKRDSSRVEITTNSGLTDLAFVRDNK